MEEETETVDAELRSDHEFQIWFNCFLAAYNKEVPKEKLMEEANTLFSAIIPYKRQLDAAKEEFMAARQAAAEAHLAQLRQAAEDHDKE